MSHAREILLPTPEDIYAAFAVLYPLARRMDLISATALATDPEQSAVVAAAYVAGYLEGSRVSALSTDAAWRAAQAAFDELAGCEDAVLPF